MGNQRQLECKLQVQNVRLCEVKGSGLVEVKFGMEDLPKAQRVSYTNQKS